MRKVVLVSVTLSTLMWAGSFLSAPLAANGEAVFESLRCGACHKPDQKAAAVPLAEIARAYGDSGKLVAFFKGESKPIIETDKPGMMRGQMPHLKALSEEDQKALADYILSVK